MIRSIFLILLGFVCLSAQPWQAAFEKGNQLYRDGKFEEAVQAYQLALKDGMESGELYFNLGNTYYKLNEVGHARLYYEKAAGLLKNDEAVITNLELVQQRLVDQIEMPPKFILSQWWDTVLNLISLNTLSWLTLIVFLLLLFSITAIMILNGKRGAVIGIYFRKTLIILFLIFLFVLINKIYLFETEKFAIILQPKVTAFASPDEQGTEVFILHEGTKVKLMRVDSDWYEIKLDDGKTGWIMTNQCEQI